MGDRRLVSSYSFEVFVVLLYFVNPTFLVLLFRWLEDDVSFSFFLSVVPLIRS